MKKTIVSLLVVSAFFLFATSASAEVFQSTLSPANEVPPLDTPMGGLAVTIVTVNCDGSSTALLIASAFGNETPIIASHFHIGPAGVAGPIICPTSGSEFQNPLIATCNFTAEQTTAMFNEGLYFNIHTQAHPGGEIRDQLHLVQ